MRNMILGFAMLATAVPAVAQAGQDKTSAADRMRSYLAECHAVHVCNGVYLVAHGKAPVFTDAVGVVGDGAKAPLTVDTAFDIGSISKQFTAMAVLKLVAANKLTLDDPAAKYLPDFPYPNITIAQLLSHTSGIPDALAYYSGLLRAGKATGPVTTDDVVAVLAHAKRPLVSEPGTRFAYSNTGYLVLAALVEKVSGQPFEAFLRQSFFKPLGMDHTWLRTPATDAAIRPRAYGFRRLPSGEVQPDDQIPGFFIRGAGGIYSTVDDLLRWEDALRSGQVVPAALYTRASTPTRLKDGTTVPYGFGLAVKPDDEGRARVGHGGDWRGFRAGLTYYPGSDVTVIQLTNNGEDDAVDNNDGALATIADGGAAPPVREEMGNALYARLDQPPAKVRAWFTQALAASPPRYLVEKRDLNALGYALLKQKRTDDAVLVFELATQAFPEVPNLYDSLADAYAAKGDNAAALKAVRKALSLAPSSVALQKREAALAAKVE